MQRAKGQQTIKEEFARKPSSSSNHNHDEKDMGPIPPKRPLLELLEYDSDIELSEEEK